MCAVAHHPQHTHAHTQQCMGAGCAHVPPLSNIYFAAFSRERDKLDDGNNTEGFSDFFLILVPDSLIF